MVTNETNKSRQHTEARILAAVGQTLAEHGFAELGINAIARRAGVDKVLIYRYFGSQAGLLAAFADRGDFWPSADELWPTRNRLAARDNPALLGAGVLKRFLRGLLARPLTLEILRCELVANNDLTRKLADAREAHGLALLEQLPLRTAATRGLDIHAIVTLLSAGLIHLALTANRNEQWLGVSLVSSKGWHRIEKALEALLVGLFKAAPARKSRSRSKRK